MKCFDPEVPADRKATNCWRIYLIFYVLGYIVIVIQFLSFDSGSFIMVIVEGIINFIFLYHTRYVRIQVLEDEINVTTGPWALPVVRWCFSSQVKKSEIVLIERKQRQCIFDVFPRCYCCPIMWCCCHKSYSAYFWPFCCNDIKCYGCCDGESDSSDMIQINFTNSPFEWVSMCCKRCAPCTPYPGVAVFWCCVYNRIAVSTPHEFDWQKIERFGYPLKLLDSNETSQLTREGMA